MSSLEALAALGAEDLELLNESVNEDWNCSIPITSPARSRISRLAIGDLCSQVNNSRNFDLYSVIFHIYPI